MLQTAHQTVSEWLLLNDSEWVQLFCSGSGSTLKWQQFRLNAKWSVQVKVGLEKNVYAAVQFPVAI